MAKKKLILNESTTRQFMKYANIKPTYVSNFLREAEEMEDDMEELGEPEELDMKGDDMAGDDVPPLDPSLDTEEEMEMGGDKEVAEELVADIFRELAAWAKGKGVDVNVETDADDMEDDMDMDGMDMDMDAAPEGGDMGLTDDAEVDADLAAADVDVAPEVDEEEVVAEVTRRVARRLLRESARRK